MTFDEILERAGRTTAQGVSFQFDLYRQGRISRDALQSTVLTLLDLSATQGANFGQVAYAQYAEAITGERPRRIATTATTVANNHKSVIRKSVDTVFSKSDLDNVAAAAVALGESLPLQAIQESYGDALGRDERVEGWERGLEPQACEMCVWWWREGALWPKDHPMPTHKGCRCQQLPRYVSAVMSTGKTRGLSESQLRQQTAYYERLREGEQ